MRSVEADDMVIISAIMQPIDSFSPVLNNALQDCARARNVFLEIKSETEQTNIDVTSPVISFCNIGVHVSDSLEGSINAIGYASNLADELGDSLSLEQQHLFAGHLQGIRNGVLKTYNSSQAVAHEVVHSLRQHLRDDPRLYNDEVAVRCIETIELRSHTVLALPATSESLRERSSTIESINSELDTLTNRAQTLNPDGPLSKFLKTFNKAVEAIAHIFKAILAVFESSSS